jgi:aspartyl-tRNA(Asn)/glutamyl-tRNA(Gln) amidotransferase subunit C
MTISEETVLKVAHLSRLQVSREEVVALAGEMEQILDWMNTLNQLDTDGVEPLIHISSELNRQRDDVASAGLGTANALANAPAKDSDYFRVPKVIE